MKTIYTLFLTLFISLLIYIPSHAATYTAAKSGLWSDASTWSGIVTPDSVLLIEDTVVIPDGITVRLNNSITMIQPISLLIVNGVLYCPDNSIMIEGGSLYGNGDIIAKTIILGTISTYDFRGEINVSNFINRNSNLFLSSTIHIKDTFNLQSGSLTIGTGAYLILDSNSTVIIDDGQLFTETGNFVPQGKYDLIVRGEGIIIQPSVLSKQLRNLTINMKSNKQHVYLSSEAVLNGYLHLIRGKLILKDYDLLLLPGSTIDGGSEESYVITMGNGSMKREVISGKKEVMFPVGTMSNYSPAILRQSGSGFTGAFKVRVQDGVYSNGTDGVDLSLSKNVVDHSWVIEEEGSSTLNFEIDLFWMGMTEANAFDRSHCFISRYSDESWDVSMSNLAENNSPNMYSTNRKNVLGIGIFAVVSDMITGVESNLESTELINIYPNPSTNGKVTIDTQFNENVQMRAEVYSMDGRRVFEQDYLGNKSTLDVSSYTHGSYLIRIYIDNVLVKSQKLII